MMSMQARNQYLHTLISQKGGYHLKSKKQKSQILDEYCRVTGQHRKAVSRKVRTGAYIQAIHKETRAVKRTRFTPYNKEVTAYLIKLWEIFDRSCGQRLAVMIRSELERLRRFGEITISDDMAGRLKTISPRTIDTKLKKHKEKEILKRKYEPKRHPLLYQKIPVKLSSDQGRGIGESIQIDLVEHCGQSAEGPFLYTLSITDIGSGWWEGEPVMGRGAYGITQAIGRIQHRFPFSWTEIHTDNDSSFINESVWRYAQRNNLDFSRSRPYAKNDNCYVEQKNGTHVRKIIGYYRYDTKVEQNVLKELYRNELPLYKNFFQSIIPLVSKERVGGRIKRKYGKPLTPYQRLMASPRLSREKKQELREIYEPLNPAALKRAIETHQDMLYQAYLKKQSRQEVLVHKKVEKIKKLNPHLATFLIAEPIADRQHELVA